MTVYFLATSPKQCFCIILQNRQTQKLYFSLNVIWLFYFKTSKHIVHRLSIYCFIPWSKQPTANVWSVLPSREHLPIQTLSPLTDSSVDNTLLLTAPNVNQSLYAFVDIVDLHLIHTLLYDSPNLVINGVQVRTVGCRCSGEIKSGVSRCKSK